MERCLGEEEDCPQGEEEDYLQGEEEDYLLGEEEDFLQGEEEDLLLGEDLREGKVEEQELVDTITDYLWRYGMG